MSKPAEPGLELAAQPIQQNGDKYYVGTGDPKYQVFDPSDQSNQQYGAKSRGLSRVTLVLIVTAIVCLAVALGAGLGVGLKAQNKPSSSGDASITSTPISNAPVTVTQSVNTVSITPTPNTPPSPACPAANGSTYVASNKPLITDASQIAQTSLSFEILCDTNVAEKGNVMDLQIITNVSTLSACMDACALFNFQTKRGHFPAFACTGISWGHETDFNPRDTCWLKSNVTLGSENDIDQYPGYDGAVLLNN